MAKIAPHANLVRSNPGQSSTGPSSRNSGGASYLAAGPGGSEAAKVAVARIEWRLGAICMEVEESGAAEGHLTAALKQWRPRVVEAISKLAIDDGPTNGSEDKKSGDEDGDGDEKKAKTVQDADDRDMMVSELVEYCRDRQRAEEKQQQKQQQQPSKSKSKSKSSNYALEVIDAMSHLGIYHHNFEHFEHGLVLLKLCEELIKDLSGADHGRANKVGFEKVKAKKEGAEAEAEAEEEEEAPLSDEAWAAAEEAARALSVHTHVVFYLAQAYAALRVPHESAEYCKVRGRYSLGIHGK